MIKKQSYNKQLDTFKDNFLCQWPQLEALAKQPDQQPYTILPVAQLEEALSFGEYFLVAEGLATARLDIILAGLWAELEEDFFHDNQFPCRLQAAADILMAAHSDLEKPIAERAVRVQLLLDDALSALQQWNHLLSKEKAEQFLFAAEEPAQRLG